MNIQFSLRRFFPIVGVCVLLGVGGETALADPPSRVARLNFLTGKVSVLPTGNTDWSSATINDPLTTGDSLWCDDDGRAEVHVGPNVIRLDADTRCDVVTLNDEDAHLRVSQGSLLVHLRSVGRNNTFEVDTPDGIAHLTRPGDYRFDVAGDGTSADVTVRHGTALIDDTTHPQFTLDAGQSAVLTRSGGGLTFDVQPAVATDPLEAWALARDRREDNIQSIRYVSPEVVGYEDLDSYGTWQDTTLYGPVWYPRTVAYGWAPYRYGHWVWRGAWGWTWVDDAPWGFAPFHYGRWVSFRGAWAWVPGPIVPRPVFAPALVGFVGGGNWGLSFGGGPSVGWFPLGPGECYRPPYQVNPTYITNVNPGIVIHERKVVTYVNQGVPGAVTAVTKETFVNGRPVNAATFINVPKAVASAPVTNGLAGLTPVKEPLVTRTAVKAAVPHPLGVSRPAVSTASVTVEKPKALQHGVTLSSAPSAVAQPVGKPHAPSSTLTNSDFPKPVHAFSAAEPSATVPLTHAVHPVEPVHQPVVREPKPSVEHVERVQKPVFEQRSFAEPRRISPAASQGMSAQKPGHVGGMGAHGGRRHE